MLNGYLQCTIQLTLQMTATAFRVACNKFHVYHFGPGDPARLPTYAGIERQENGVWRVAANTPVTVTLPGSGAVEIRSRDTWHKLESTPGDGTLTFALGGEHFADGQARVRVR